ncbi:hypothetical protein C1645_874394 [Glomus cerebriforme]|uniref:Crinkler effector protein N-terminal domain-containing protein n=1 Tax=Glomus cerebriforme TaxID=658196 RepID=A0A397T9I1_9GLOM|nr:hypothetical protein C1645_874394 [Glomus cerebriforme]
MSTIRLNCLVRGNLPEHAFEVEIGKNDSISDLKQIISDEKDVIAKELILWKVNTSTSEKMKFERLKSHMLSIKEVLGGEEMKSKIRDIDYYFPDDYIFLEEYINLMVDLSYGVDEKLEKSWNALKNGKIINIQQSENHLSGIGKTFFGYYLLYRLAQLNKTVIYYKENKCAILFSEKGTFYYNDIYDLKRYLYKSNVWYIVDNRILRYYNDAMTIIIYSPQERYYKDFDKIIRNVEDIMMSVWSWEEINTCRHVNFDNLSQKKVWELYEKWGGIPLFTLDYALDESKQILLQRAIDIVDYQLLKYFDELYDDKDIRHRLVHIFFNETQYDVTQFASEYVAEKIVNKLEMYYKDELLEFMNRRQYEEYSGLHKPIFEYIAHRTLLNGGSFEIYSLTTKSISKLTMPKRDKLVFNNPNDIEPGKYCVPSKKDFENDINAIVSPNMIFLMIVSENHPIHKNGLDKLIDKFINKSDESIIEIYFVIPKIYIPIFNE